MDSSIILSICQVVAVAIIPLVVFLAGNGYEKRRAKIEAKRDLFFTLMRNRKSSMIFKEKIDAFNLIDVVFQDDKKVRAAWKDYLDALNPNSPNVQNSNSFLLDLLSEMAISLGYKELKQTEIDRFYEPQGIIDDWNDNKVIRTEFTRVLKSSKSFAESYNEQQNQDNA